MNCRISLIGAIILAAAVLSAAGASAQDKANFKDGMWEITSTMTMEGMAMGSQTSTVKQCMKSDNPVPANKNSNCKIDSLNISGNTVAWKMTCDNPQGGKVQSNGKMTYENGTSFYGTMETSFAGAQQEMKMQSDMRGHYVGPCTNGK